jgi:hypothetical protein
MIGDPPYLAEDRPLAASMTNTREAGNGDRYYEYPLRGHATAPQFGRSTEQQFFYRAMHRDEAKGWLMVAGTSYGERTAVYQGIAAVQVNGHQGWASHRDYSMEYLSPRHGYTHLLEVHAPDFIQWLAEIGVNSGKAEAGDISWGVGLTTSNGFQGTPETNKALKTLYGKVVNNGVEIAHTQVPGGLRAMAKAVTPYVFQQSIKYAKLVVLRSVRP